MLCTNCRLAPMLITAMPAKNVRNAGSPPEATFHHKDTKDTKSRKFNRKAAKATKVGYG